MANSVAEKTKKTIKTKLQALFFVFLHITLFYKNGKKPIRSIQ